MSTPVDKLFKKHFTLEEAAALLPEMRKACEDARQDLGELKDQIVLYKRMHLAKKHAGISVSTEETALLQQKWEAFEEAFHQWLAYFTEKGIQVRDLEKGLIDFPYKSKGGEEYLLCWLYGEDGIFYFHDPFEGFRGRKPITFLPD